jgi:hypothetical protein
VALPKAEPGVRWRALFRGDPDGARCAEPLYQMTETNEEVILEFTLPFWTEPEDVRVDISEAELAVEARGQLSLRRTYWRNREEEARRRDYRPVDPEQSAWTLDDDEDETGERCRMLTVVLARPPPTEEEVAYKRGRRQDNRAAQRPGSMQLKGFRFFADDEDEYGLEDVLCALCFAEEGKARVAAKPWVHGAAAYVARDETLLPPEAAALVRRLRENKA